jgi:hypothetical protein
MPSSSGQTNIPNVERGMGRGTGTSGTVCSFSCWLVRGSYPAVLIPIFIIIYPRLVFSSGLNNNVALSSEKFCELLQDYKASYPRRQLLMLQNLQ